MRKMIDYILGSKGTRFTALPGILLNMAVLGGAYYLVSNKTPGWLTYGMIVPPSLINLITCVARVNDMSSHDHDWRWHLRKLGFIVAGTASVAFLTQPFTLGARFPSWSAVMLAWGVAASWFTTPNMVPWWRYISGEFRQKDLVKMAEGEKTNVLTK
jgi:hypothetical protein